MTGLRLHFWDWKEPVLRHAVALLLEGWQGGVLDLSDRVLLVPTAETGRRLREALAQAVAEKEGVVTAPYVWSPEAALMSGADRTKIAQPLQERMAWMAVLEKVGPEDVKALLPVFDGKTDEGWQAGMAEALCQLKRTLGAGGLDMQAVVGVLKEGDERDVERWMELAELERRYAKKLEQHMGLVDLQAAKRAAVKEVVMPEGVKRVQVLALPDPPTLLRDWLGQVAKRVRVEVYVHAAAEARPMFDELGTPRGESWGQMARPLLPLGDEDLAMEGTPADQAARMLALLKEMALGGMNVAVGSADLEVNAPVEAALAAEGVRVYDPAGHGAQGHPLLVVLRSWLEVLRSGLWKDVAAFLHIEDVLRVVSTEEMRATALLRQLDKLHEEHLPPTLSEAVSLCADAAVKAVLEGMGKRVQVWESITLEKGLREVLEWVYGEREFDTAQHEDGDHAKLMGEALALAAGLDATVIALGMHVSAGGLLAVLLDELSGTTLADVRGEVDLVLHGWLELPWEPARGLVIAGFNEESVPGIVTGDAFLPDGLRKRLKLACQASRRARDAYLLRAMAEQRRKDGALKLVLGRVNEQGEGLRPSRLLFDCADTELVQRVRKLFPVHDAEGAQDGRVPPRSVAFLLKPRLAKGASVVESVSPSMLRTYLSCPFQFYLKQVLKMQPVEAGLNEATPMVFGTLVHEVLQRYAESEAMRECVDGAVVAGWLDGEVERVWKKQFGPSPLLSVVMQMETARQRLLAVAESLAGLRAEGWRTLHVEQRVVDWGLEIGGLPFSGKIDRVDRRYVDGREEFLLLDYKTGKATEPVKSHLSRMTDEEMANERVAWQGYEMSAKWVDLQLPLYAWALRKRYAGRPVSVGYFHLPVMVSDAGLRYWEDLDDAVIADALRCAEEAVRRIREGDFWPPAEELKYQDYAFLLGDAQMTIDPTELLLGREEA